MNDVYLPSAATTTATTVRPPSAQKVRIVCAVRVGLENVSAVLVDASSSFASASVRVVRIIGWKWRLGSFHFDACLFVHAMVKSVAISIGAAIGRSTVGCP